MWLTCEDQKQQFLLLDFMLGWKFMKESSYKVGKYISSKLENNSYRMILNLKACVRYFSFFQPMITLKKL